MLLVAAGLVSRDAQARLVRVLEGDMGMLQQFPPARPVLGVRADPRGDLEIEGDAGYVKAASHCASELVDVDPAPLGREAGRDDQELTLANARDHMVGCHVATQTARRLSHHLVSD